MDRLQLLQTLEGHTDRVWHLAWSPDGASLASCSGDRTVRIWQQSKQPGKGWRCAAVLEDTHTKSIRCCSWSPGGNCLATASFDGITAIWQVDSGYWEEVMRLEGHESEVKAVAWSPCGNFIATCGRDKTVWFWEVVGGKEYDCMDVKPGHSQDVKSVTWHPRRELLASCSYDDSIKLWVQDEGDWICAQTLEGAASGHTSTVWSVAFSKDGSRLASVSADCTLRVWRLGWTSSSSTDPRATLSAAISGCHKRPVFSVDWSADDVIATGDASNAVKLFGQPLALEAALSSCADGEQQQGQQPSQAAAAAEASAGSIAEAACGSEAEAASAQPGSMEAAPEAAPEAAAGEEPWECLCSVDHAHDSDVNCVRWHPQQRDLLASAGDDGRIKLWRWSRSR